MGGAGGLAPDVCLVRLFATVRAMGRDHTCSMLETGTKNSQDLLHGGGRGRARARADRQDGESENEHWLWLRWEATPGRSSSERYKEN
eukprot:1963469-Pyramimonas_sp.AAC.1